MNIEEATEQGWEVLNAEPSANWRPGQKKARVRKSVDHTIRHGVRSMLRSVSARPDFDLPDLRSLDELRGEVIAAEQRAVDTLRAKGHSWQEIANALGCSKPNVIQRFGGSK